MKRILTALVLSLLLGALSLWLVSSNLFGKEVWQALEHFRLRWLAAVFTLILCWWLVSGYRMIFLARRIGSYPGLWGGVQTHIVGVFSSSITPAGGGNSIGIALLLMRLGLKPENAVVVTVMSLVGDLAFFSWTMPASFFLLLRYGINLPIDHLGVFILIVSCLALALSYLLVFRLSLATALAKRLFTLRFVRRFRNRKISRFLADLELASTAFASSPWSWHLRFHGLSTIARLCFFATLNLILLGLDIDFNHLVVLASQIVVHAFAFVIPTPGASGYQEAAITFALKGEIPAQLLTAAVIIWRFTNYYLYFIAGSIVGGVALLGVTRPGDRPGADPRRESLPH